MLRETACQELASLTAVMISREKLDLSVRDTVQVGRNRSWHCS
jgi:hypothetical protein